MTKEIERCHAALKEAESGKTVAMVCSGDAGVFGMAGLIYQLSEEYSSVEIIPVAGVTAALSGSAVLGAPLTHDFAVISLSDLLTPWELIETRLKAAGMGDFCTVLYNPASKKRADYLLKACDFLMEKKSPDTICGYVRNIGREGQEHKILTLKELREEKLDMFCTVFIGNKDTKIIKGKMVTPRGYEKRM
jgi:precorrin-3B C17-methyltransferase